MGVKYGISKRRDGSMKHLKPDINRENRQNFFSSLGLGADKTVMAGLAHGAKTALVDESFSGQVVDGVDALVTDKSGLVLAVTVADCLPLYLFCPGRNIIALAHIGWLGLDKGIVCSVLEAIKDAYCRDLSGFYAVFGPHIGSCCYEVKSDVADRFKLYPEAIQRRGQKIFLNLASIASAQLAALGVPEKRILASQECTMCAYQSYFSHRRDQNDPVKAQIAYIYQD